MRDVLAIEIQERTLRQVESQSNCKKQHYIFQKKKLFLSNTAHLKPCRGIKNESSRSIILILDKDFSDPNKSIYMPSKVPLMNMNSPNMKFPSDDFIFLFEKIRIK